jgi:hypothetical protein
MNPAEAAAEQILKGAYDEAQAEACPEGRECAVHFRNSGEYIDEKEQYARLIDYVGEYAVVTSWRSFRRHSLALSRSTLASRRASTSSARARLESWVTRVSRLVATRTATSRCMTCGRKYTPCTARSCQPLRLA